MKYKSLSWIEILFLLLLAACASPQSNKTVGATDVPTGIPTNVSSPSTEKTPKRITTSEPVVQSSQAGSFFTIDELGLGLEGYVSLTNFTNVPVSVKGLYLCQGKDCFALPDATVGAGSTGRVAVGDGEGLEGVIATKATIGELKASDGEMALFASDKFDDPKALLDYIQWGSTPHALTRLAVDAGQWIETGYAPTSDNATRIYRVEESGQWIFEEAKP